MSFFVGPVSGALVAGGIYYGFSTLIQTRTDQHRSDLHNLAQRLLDPSSSIRAPLPAIHRIAQHPFESMLKSQWNAQIETLFEGASLWGHRASEWGRNLLYDGDIPLTKRN